MMMNFRRIAAGSLHLLHKSATRSKPSDSGVIARLRWTTRALSTTESAETAATTSPSDPNEGVVFFSKDNLMSRVNSLHKEGKHELALHLFDSMDAQKVEFTPSEFAFHIEILAKVKGLAAAKAYFKKADPDFNNRDHHAKNWPAYATLARLTSEELDELANHLHPLRNSYSRMAELVSPSVVSILARNYSEEKGARNMFGSGFFIDNTTILTCSNIVVNSQRLTDESYLNSRQEPKVVLHDGTELDGTLVRYDSVQDVAMVRVDTSGLPDGSYSPVKLGFPNRVRQGDWIGCFGAPLQLPNTITFGVVSAIRTAEELDMGDRKGQFFQMDCTVCGGSGGGPIVSLDGSVIGMTCLSFGDPTGPTQDSGIAVSIDSVLRVLELV
ncbi:unnamed protein product [Arabidopsis arenosa]|uniref:Uncharacterized protein n=1 Tax=Arabidopsis arenosa TaxID=38785 RepID=A0A8S1ZIW6_ARAAE|nr:unnamed protein product [Arabidopsis arenosa]